MLAAFATAATLACAPPPVTGGTGAERAAIGRMVCLIPHTQIRGVQLVEPPTTTRVPGGIGVRILLDSRVGSVPKTRAQWEAEVAGRAFAAGFARLGLPPVAAYAANTVATPPDPLAPEREVVDTPPTGVPETPTRGETWTQIEARFDALDRRFGVHSHLDRVNAFEKTPAVTVVVRDPVRFLGGDGIVAYLKALRARPRPYATVYLGVRWRGAEVWTLSTVGGAGGGCGYAIAPGAGRGDAATRACGLAGFDFP